MGETVVNGLFFPSPHGRCDLGLIYSTIAANPMQIVATRDA